MRLEADSGVAACAMQSLASKFKILVSGGVNLNPPIDTQNLMTNIKYDFIYFYLSFLNTDIQATVFDKRSPCRTVGYIARLYSIYSDFMI